MADWTSISLLVANASSSFGIDVNEVPCRLVSDSKDSIRFSEILPSNPSCRAANHLSLSLGLGAEHRNCIPEYVRIKKSHDLVSWLEASSLNMELVEELARPLLPLSMVWIGFQDEAPTMFIIDVGASPFEYAQKSL